MINYAELQTSKGENYQIFEESENIQWKKSVKQRNLENFIRECVD